MQRASVCPMEMPSIPAHTGGTQLSGISSSSTTARSSSLAAHSLPNHEDDESEWEYEYSATETETFYVTLDLSTQDFTDKRTKTIHHGRGGYQGEKQAELFETSRQSPGVAGDSAGRPGSTAVASDHDEGQPQGASPPRHGEVVMRGLESRGWSRRDSVGGGSGGGMGGRGGEEEEEDEADLDEVQIMELHSANPVISYRGRVYAAQWHQNIGTEFLLTRHDDDNHLPVLRHLDNGVDLLAASSARISVAQKELKRKDNPDNNSHDNHSSHLHQQRRQRGKRRARSTRPSGVITESQDGEEVEDENDDEIDVLVPAPDSGASQARVDQGNFLRDFIALKRSRGETDEVPVLTSADHLPKRAPSKRKTTATTTTPGRGRGQGAGGGRPCGSRRGRGGRGGSAAGHSARSLLNIAEQWGIGSTAPGGGGSGGDDDVEMANLDPALSAATPTRFADAAGTQSSSVDAAGGSMDGDTGASR